MSGESEIKGGADTMYRRDQVVTIVNSVIGKIQSPQGISFDVVNKELNSLKDAIETMRTELQAAQPNAIQKTHIPTATDELDAVVETTEKATGSIMDSCEAIMGEIQGSDPELVQKIEAHIVSIYEACTFQDITGQRIKKVVTALKTIDQKVSHMLQTLGERFAHLRDEDHGDATKEKPSLLNGPALPNQGGVSQDDIDRLLAEFDS